MKDSVSRLSIKIVCRDHPKERARKLMAEGGSDRDGGTGTFLGIWRFFVDLNGRPPMPQSHTSAWAILPDQKAVDQTIQRLTQGGFPRNKITTKQRPDKRYDIHVDTSPDRLREVERLIHASAPLYALRETTKGVGDTIASNPC
jgi:hypothetical protein